MNAFGMVHNPSRKNVCACKSSFAIIAFVDVVDVVDVVDTDVEFNCAVLVPT